MIIIVAAVTLILSIFSIPFITNDWEEVKKMLTNKKENIKAVGMVLLFITVVVIGGLYTPLKLPLYVGYLLFFLSTGKRKLTKEKLQWLLLLKYSGIAAVVLFGVHYLTY